jgi:hypothetical protein
MSWLNVSPIHYASPGFVAAFTGSPQERAVQTTIILLHAGTTQFDAKRLTSLEAWRLGLPGNGRYNRYPVPGFNGNQGRLAVPESRNGSYFYGPYHGNPGPGVPTGWIEIHFPVFGAPKR